jgi:hypothetical protein
MAESAATVKGHSGATFSLRARSCSSLVRFVADWRERDVGAFETDPHERLVQYRRTFGSGGTLESLTLLEDMTDSSKRGGSYLAAFGSGTRMIWTVALRADGAVDFDGTRSR